MWETISIWVAIFLLGNMAVGLLWAFRGAEPAGHLLAALLFGTTGVAILLLLAESMRLAVLRDVALVLVALAALAVMVLSAGAERAGRS